MTSIDAKSRETLQESKDAKTPVFFVGDALDITFETHILKVADDYILIENRVKPRFINKFASSKRFTLQVRMIRFQAGEIRTDGEHIIFPLREDSVIEETRQSERFSFTADERVICELQNPYDNETRLSKSVMDMSATGLSLRTTFDSKLFKASTRFPAIKVLIDGEPYFQGAGRVVYSRKMLDLGGQLRTQVGIKFEQNK